MITATITDLPTDITFRQEWQRITYDPFGEHVEDFNSPWYKEEAVARSSLNPEYPEPTRSGFRHILRTRWVSEYRPVKI